MTDFLAELPALAEKAQTETDARHQLAWDLLDNLPAILALGRERDALRSAVERIARFPNRVKMPAQDARDMQSIARQALEGGNHEG